MGASNVEDILQNILDGSTEYKKPYSRVEILLVQIKDLIAQLQSAVNLKGETTTPLTDNATTNPIMIDGKSYTAVMNDAVIYQSGEFIFDGTKWHELGDLSKLTAANIGAMTGYTKASSGSDIAPADTLNQAIGKVEKRVDVNENNILLKANTSDVSAATANLQAQIDNIVTPVTQDAEVQNARVGADGTSYTTLKQRLDYEANDINFKINSLADVELIPLNDIIYGVLAWNETIHDMVHTDNAKRLTSDLRPLNLTQGSTIGITDYDTYSIAFGDNLVGWYDNGYQTHDVTANDNSILPYVCLIKRNDNADMTDADIEAITAQFHSTSTEEPVVDVTLNEQVIEDINRKKLTNNFIHFSFDDVTISFANLNDNKNVFDSIFEEPFFNYLKKLHDTYGAKFSLYVQNVTTLNSIGSIFKSEFIENNDWLKLGYHSYTTENMKNITVSQAKANYDNFISYAMNMAGANSIDRIPRLNSYGATPEQLIALRDTKCGIYGLLTPDDDRTVNYLNEQQHDYLYDNDHLYDLNNGMIYYSTNFRLDTFISGFTTDYNYHRNTETNPYDELVARYSNPDYANYNQNLIIFTHEWQIYSVEHTLKNPMQTYVEQTLKFAKDYNYQFDYVQNRVQDIKSLSMTLSLLH